MANERIKPIENVQVIRLIRNTIPSGGLRPSSPAGFSSVPLHDAHSVFYNIIYIGETALAVAI